MSWFNVLQPATTEAPVYVIAITRDICVRKSTRKNMPSSVDRTKTSRATPVPKMRHSSRMILDLSFLTLTPLQTEQIMVPYFAAQVLHSPLRQSWHVPTATFSLWLKQFIGALSVVWGKLVVFYRNSVIKTVSRNRNPVDCNTFTSRSFS